MKFLKLHGWMIAAFGSALIVTVLTWSKPYSASLFLLVCSIVVWRRESKRVDHIAEKKILTMSAAITVFGVMTAKTVDDYLQTHVGINGYVATVIFIIPLVVWLGCREVKTRMAEEAAKHAAEGGSVA